LILDSTLHYMDAYVGRGGATPRIRDNCTIWRSVQLRAPDKELPVANQRAGWGVKVALDVNPKLRFRNPNSGGSINLHPANVENMVSS